MAVYQIDYYIVALDKKENELFRNFVKREFVEASTEDEVVNALKSIYGDLKQVTPTLYLTLPLIALNNKGEMVSVTSPYVNSYRVGGFDIKPVTKIFGKVDVIPVTELVQSRPFIGAFVRKSSIGEGEMIRIKNPRIKKVSVAKGEKFMRDRKRKLLARRAKASNRASEWVDWYEYMDYDPVTNRSVLKVRQANVKKSATEVFEDELISLREENVTLKQLLGKMNKEIENLKKRNALILKILSRKKKGSMKRRATILKSSKIRKLSRVFPTIASPNAGIPAKRASVSKKFVGKYRLTGAGKLEKEKGNCPAKWVHYWESLTGDVEHKMTKCMEKCEKAGFADDCARFCAAVKDCVLGTTEWRRGRKPKRSSVLRNTAMKRRFRLIAKRKKRATEEGEVAPPTPPEEKAEAPKPEPRPEPKPEGEGIKATELLVKGIAQALGVDVKDIEVSNIFFDKEKGVIQISYKLGNESQVAYATLKKRNTFVLKAANDRTYEIKFDGKKVVYDIPTRTVNPFPTNKKPTMAIEEDGLPKGVQEIAVEGFDAPKSGDTLPTLAFQESIKGKDEELVKLATEVTDEMVRKGIIPREQRDEQIALYLKKYSSADALRSILNVVRKIESSVTVIVDDEGKPIDLSKVLD